MKRVVQVVALTGLMTLAAGWVAAAPAGAATPQVVHTKVNVSLTNIDVCGFTVNSVIQGTDTTQIFFDRSGNVAVQDVSHVVSTLTNVANGKVVYVANASRDAFTPDGVVNPDGTITFTDTLTGMPVRIYTSHSNTLVKDVGFLSIVDTVRFPGELPQRAGDRARAAPVRGRLHGVLRRDRVRDRVVRRILVRGRPLRSPLCLQAHTHAAASLHLPGRSE